MVEFIGKKYHCYPASEIVEDVATYTKRRKGRGRRPKVAVAKPPSSADTRIIALPRPTIQVPVDLEYQKIKTGRTPSNRSSIKRHVKDFSITKPQAPFSKKNVQKTPIFVETSFKHVKGREKSSNAILLPRKPDKEPIHSIVAHTKNNFKVKVIANSQKQSKGIRQSSKIATFVRPSVIKKKLNLGLQKLQKFKTPTIIFRVCQARRCHIRFTIVLHLFRL